MRSRNVHKFRKKKKSSTDLAITIAVAGLAGFAINDFLPKGILDTNSTFREAVPTPRGNIKGLARIIDGDTIEIDETIIRLHGIDAPELQQTCQINSKTYSCGIDSKAYLQRLINYQDVICNTINTDKYGRDVSKCFNYENIDINSKMVSSGNAIAYLYYSNDYFGEQTGAKFKKDGIWRGDFIEPYIFRNSQR